MSNAGAHLIGAATYAAEARYEHDGDDVCPAKGVYVDNAEQISYWIDSDGNGTLVDVHRVRQPADAGADLHQ